MVAFDITSGSTDGSLGVSATSAQTLYSNSSFLYNFAIAGKPFISAVSTNDPFQRAFAQVRRQQVDTAQMAGEQSLDYWWLRSQFDWSAGAGQALFEPANDPIIRSKFLRSQGVDCWTQGQITLLPAMSSLVATAACRVVSARTTGGTEYLVHSTGAATSKYDGTTTTAITGLTAQPTWLWSAGSQVLACHSTGIDRIDPSGTTGVSMYDAAASTPKVWWVKQRIMAAVANSIYELPYRTAAAAGLVASATSSYTHPDPGWVWTSVVDTPGAILAAGYSGSKGGVYRFELTSTGTLPSLSAAITTAELPQGEWPTGMIAYLGAFVAIGTNQGIRIATVSDTGQLAYGPLTVETASAVEHFTAKDSYIFAGVTAGQADGTSGLVRIDLGAPDGTGRYAYAYDVATTDTAAITGVTQFGSTGRLTVASGSIWLQHATAKVASGWLETAATLFGTLELKQFNSALMRATIAGGSITISTVKDGIATSLLNYVAPPSEDVGISPWTPVDRLSLRFDLTRDATDTSISPSLLGWQIRALPVVTRKELVQVPLLCYDNERDTAGNIRYSDAWDRYTALRDAVADQGTVTFQNLDTGEVMTGVLQDLSFKQMAPPEGFDGFGGFITVSIQGI